MIEIGYRNGEKILIKLFDNSISKKLIDTYSKYLLIHTNRLVL